MSSNTTKRNTNALGEDLWSVAFSNVGRAHGKPLKEEEVANAIQAISGPSVGNGTADTSHATQSQLYMNPPPTQQQEGSEQQYDFVMCDPQSANYGAGDTDVITSGTGGMDAGPPPYPNKSCGIPGRRGHLLPGSSRPWRVNEQS